MTGRLLLRKGLVMRTAVGLLIGVATLMSLSSTVYAVDINSPRYQPPTVAHGQLFGQDFCNEQGAVAGVGDMIWLTGKGGTQVVEINAGDAYANVTVQAAGRYCGGHNPGTLVGGYYQSILNGDIPSAPHTPDGRISGYITYPQAGPNEGYYDYAVNQSLLVTGWKEGLHKVCLEVTTNYPGAIPVPSPNACFTIELVINNQWNLTNRSYVSVNNTTVNQTGTITGAVGQRIRWKHTITNNGPDSIPPNTIGYKVEGFGSDNVTERKIGPQFNPSVYPVTTYYNVFSKKLVPAEYVITAADVGKTLCQFITSWPYSSEWSGVNYIQSPQACVTVPYSFTLTPTVGSLGRTEIQPGQTLNPIQPVVTNSGSTKSYPDTPWQLVQFTVPSGGTKPGAGTGTVLPCVYYGNGCLQRSSGTQANPFNPGATNLPPYTADPIADLPSGSQVCFALAVKGYGVGILPSGPNWKYSVAQCVLIAKKPTVQIWGGDVRVGGMIVTSSSSKGTAIYGSWAEYGVMSVLSNTNFASGSGLSGGSTASEKQRNGLTFANIDNSRNDSYGSYTSALPASTSASYFMGLSNRQALPSSNLSSVAGFQTGKPVLVYTVGDVTLSQSAAMPAGKSVVIVSSGTVTINKDLTYTNAALTSIKDIPQLIIIAKHINITDAVKQIDAWLLTTSTDNSDSISTCSNIIGNLSTTLCSNPLVVNGPVATRRLDLRRTAGAGAGAQSGDPAEIINLRPDVYIWGRLEATGAGKAQTVSSTELPPRF